MNALIIGWGNPLAGSDGIGPRAVEHLAGRIGCEADVMACSASPLRLIEAMRGYERVVVADVYVDVQDDAIRRHVLHPRDLPAAPRLSRHDGTLTEALQTLRALGDTDLPNEIVLLSVPVSSPPEDWQDRLAPEAERAAERLAEAVRIELEVTAVV